MFDFLCSTQICFWSFLCYIKKEGKEEKSETFHSPSLCQLQSSSVWQESSHKLPRPPVTSRLLLLGWLAAERCWGHSKRKRMNKKNPKQSRVSGTYWWWRSRRGRPGSPRWPAPGWWGGPSCGAAAWPTWAAPPPRGQRARRRDTTGTPSTTSLTGRRNIDQTQPEDVQTQCGPNNPDRFLQMSDGRHDSTAKYLL